MRHGHPSDRAGDRACEISSAAFSAHPPADAAAGGPASYNPIQGSPRRNSLRSGSWRRYAPDDGPWTMIHRLLSMVYGPRKHPSQHVLDHLVPVCPVVLAGSFFVGEVKRQLTCEVTEAD